MRNVLTKGVVAAHVVLERWFDCTKRDDTAYKNGHGNGVADADD